MIIGEIDEADPNFAELVDALQADGAGLGLADGGQEERSQNCYNCDNDQQLDKRQAPSGAAARHELHT